MVDTTRLIYTRENELEDKRYQSPVLKQAGGTFIQNPYEKDCTLSTS
jgi:hypothetical protein